MNVKYFRSGSGSDCQEIHRLRKGNVATLCYNDLKNTVGTAIMCHNVRSLTLYHYISEDIKTDDWYSSCLLYTSRCV